MSSPSHKDLRSQSAYSIELVEDFLLVFQEPRTLVLVTSSNTFLEASPSSQVLLGFSQAQLQRTLLTTLVHPCDISHLLKATPVHLACPPSRCDSPSICEKSFQKAIASSVPFLRGLRSSLLASGSVSVSLITSFGEYRLFAARLWSVEEASGQRLCFLVLQERGFWSPLPPPSFGGEGSGDSEENFTVLATSDWVIVHVSPSVAFFAGYSPLTSLANTSSTYAVLSKAWTSLFLSNISLGCCTEGERTTQHKTKQNKTK